MQANTPWKMLPSLQQYEIGTSELEPFRSSILGPSSPLRTLHGCPREQNLVHHSGPGRLARPSPWGTCTSYSLPASWRTQLWVIRVVFYASKPVRLSSETYRVLLFSVRGLSDDILFVEKGSNRCVGPGHLRVGKSAMLAAQDCHELVADSRFVECLMEADIL